MFLSVFPPPKFERSIGRGAGGGAGGHSQGRWRRPCAAPEPGALVRGPREVQRSSVCRGAGGTTGGIGEKCMTFTGEELNLLSSLGFRRECRIFSADASF